MSKSNILYKKKISKDHKNRLFSMKDSLSLIMVLTLPSWTVLSLSSPSFLSLQAWHMKPRAKTLTTTLDYYRTTIQQKFYCSRALSLIYP